MEWTPAPSVLLNFLYESDRGRILPEFAEILTCPSRAANMQVLPYLELPAIIRCTNFRVIRVLKNFRAAQLSVYAA